jgi:hypothetical protein
VNLRELKSMTYGLLNDASQQAVNFGTIVGYLNIAQNVLGNLLWNVDREKFLGINYQSTVNGTRDYSTPTDLRELVRVTIGNYEATRFPVRDLNAINANTLYRGVWPNQIWYNEMEGTAPGKTTVRIFPTPIAGAGGDGVAGTATASSTTTITLPTGVGASAVDDFYNGMTIYFVTGAVAGTTAIVTDYVGSTRVVTFAVQTDPGLASVVIGDYDLLLWYYRRPVDFHVNGTYDGIATGVGATSTILDTAAPFNTTATTNTDFWKNAQIRFTSGSNNGILRRVSSQTLASSTITFTPVVVTATTTGDTYELDQMSILPEHVHYLMPYYAAGLASSKVGMDGSSFMGLWNAEIEAMRRRLVDNVEVNIPGEVSQGAAKARQ